MAKLWIMTVVWAFSFSLIGVYLAGQVDGYIAVFSRMVLALVVFLPFFRPRLLPNKQVFALVGIGAIQLGLMYIFFYHSFLFISVPEVLLFTIMTPVYVSLIDSLMDKKSVSFKWLVPALTAVVGAAIIRYQPVSEHFFVGLLLVQGANLCFAFGQVAYKRLPIAAEVKQHHVFLWFFVGATLVSGCAAAMFANWQNIPSTITHWSVILWLGVGASGIGYFLWNSGAKQVATSQLAVMNNMLIPAGLIVNLLIWGHGVDAVRLVIGSGFLIASLYLIKRLSPSHL